MSNFKKIGIPVYVSPRPITPGLSTKNSEKRAHPINILYLVNSQSRQTYSESILFCGLELAMEQARNLLSLIGFVARI